LADLRHYDEADFKETVLDSTRPVLVDFYADWCGPCRMMNPVINELVTEYSEQVEIGKLDTDASPGVAIRFGIMGIPTLGLFIGGKMVDRLVGYPGPQGVRSWLDRALEKSQAA